MTSFAALQAAVVDQRQPQRDHGAAGGLHRVQPVQR
jgi:hypothetical protein